MSKMAVKLLFWGENAPYPHKMNFYCNNMPFYARGEGKDGGGVGL